MSSQCFDSDVWQDLPPNSNVMLYKDGLFAAPADAPQQLHATGVRYITVTGDYRGCGAIDWETGNPCFTAAGLRGYVRGRRALNAVARVYCDRADAHEALWALYDSGHGTLGEYDKLVWWISTLDNVQWTADALARELAANWDAPIAASKLWGNQYGPAKPGAHYDTSNVYGNL